MSLAFKESVFCNFFTTQPFLSLSILFSAWRVSGFPLLYDAPSSWPLSPFPVWPLRAARASDSVPSLLPFQSHSCSA